MARPMCPHGYIDEAIGHCDECHPIDRRPLSLEEEIVWRADKGPILGPDHEHIARLWATLDAVRAQQAKCRVDVAKADPAATSIGSAGIRFPARDIHDVLAILLRNRPLRRVDRLDLHRRSFVLESLRVVGRYRYVLAPVAHPLHDSVGGHMRLIIEVDNETGVFMYRETEKRFQENEPKREAEMQKGTLDMLSRQCDLHDYSGVYWTFKV